MKRILSFLLASIVVLSTLLTGCTSSNGAKPADVKNAQGGKGGKVTLSMWVYEPIDKRNLFDDMINKFEEKTGYQVNVTYVPKDDFNTKINTAVATGVGPDVFYLDQPLVPKFAEDGIILNLEKYAKGDKGIDKSKFYTGALDTSVVKGELYGLPLDQTCVALYYNKNLVKNPPKTWDEWLQLGKNVYQKGKVATFEIMPAGGYGAWLFPAFIYSAGGTMVSDDLKKVAFDQKPGIDSLNFIKEMKKYSDKEITDSANAFQNGLIATKISGPWEIQTYRQNNPGLNFGVALIPKKDASCESSSNIGGENLVISQETKNADAAWELLKFLTYDTKNQITIADVTGNFPVLYEAANNPKYQNDEDYKVFLEQMKTAKARPAITSWLKINDEVISKAIDQVLSGGMTAEQALKEAAQKANTIIEQGR